jgi:alpha-tubulin suppressor-like RCC1 family protein
VRCWGRDADGQLGDGAGAPKSRPASVPGLAGVSQIALSGSYSCALLADRSVTCWGSGRLAGDAKQLDSVKLTPVVGVSNVDAIAGSGLLTCALAKGDVKCWGLATDPTLPRFEAPVVEVAVASSHGCARYETGRVECWGTGAWAPGTKGSFAKPNLADVQQVVTGDDFGCALTKSQAIKCWGRNEYGQLGKAPDFDTHTNALDVPVKGAVKLAAGESSVCAILQSGSLTCWGDNSEGQLGVGRSRSTELPTAVGGLGDVAAMCFASSHACARTKSSDVWCWGSNTAGQLGDGTLESKLTPTRVSF